MDSPGEAIGAVMKNCSVGGTTTVSGNDCSGGFVGRSANAVVAGTLSSLGIELMGKFSGQYSYAELQNRRRGKRICTGNPI